MQKFKNPDFCDGLMVGTWVTIAFVILGSLLSSCSSDPKDDPRVYSCGNGYYARTKAQCP